jgi:tripartite-type tricarboxylate transporter receptor subunit TctC
VQGLEPAGTSAKDFTAFINAEQKKWGEVAKRENIRIKD